MAVLLARVIDEALRNRPTDFTKHSFDYLYARGYVDADLPTWCYGESDYAGFKSVDFDSRRRFAPVWYWLVEPVRRVFEELQKDRKARAVLLSALPKPASPPPLLEIDEIRQDDVGKTFKSVFGFCYTFFWKWRYDITHPKTLSPAAAEEMGRRAAILHKQYGLKGDSKIRPHRLEPRAIEAMFGDLGPLPPPFSEPPLSAYYVNGASSPEAKQWAKFHSTFDGPAVHLWGLWKCWPDITGRPGLAPAPEYPDANRLGPQAATFEQCVARSRFRLFSFVEASPNRAAMICKSLEWLQGALLEVAPLRHRRRNRGDSEKVRALTVKQTEAVHIVGECQGNIVRAAKQLGRDPSTIRQHYNAAMRKLGRSAVRDKKPTVSAIPVDQRGQATLADRNQGPLPSCVSPRSKLLSDKRKG